jgi:hypothetical protein
MILSSGRGSESQGLGAWGWYDHGGVLSICGAYDAIGMRPKLFSRVIV